MYNRVYDLDLDFTDHYDFSIRFDGDFQTSLSYIISYMNNTGKPQYLLQFNPDISDKSFIWYYYDTRRLNCSTHTCYQGYARPYSRVIYGNNLAFATMDYFNWMAQNGYAALAYSTIYFNRQALNRLFII